MRSTLAAEVSLPGLLLLPLPALLLLPLPALLLLPLPALLLLPLPALLLLPLPAGSLGSLQGLLHYTGQGDSLLTHTGPELHMQAPFADILSLVSTLGIPEEVCSRVNRPGETLYMTIGARAGAQVKE